MGDLDQNLDVHECPIEFRIKCPKKWNAMRRTKIEGIRFCEACREEVHFCGTIQEVQHARSAGFCIAIHPSLGSYDDIPDHEFDQLVLGMLDDE